MLVMYINLIFFGVGDHGGGVLLQNWLLVVMDFDFFF